MQRVALARALANDPPIVLADEPTGNLDSHSGILVLDLLYRSCKEIGTTLILATHDHAVVQRADRIVELRDGLLPASRQRQMKHAGSVGEGTQCVDVVAFREPAGSVTASSEGVVPLVGIALGVAVFIAVRVTNSSTLGAFARTVDAIAGRAGSK